MTKRQTQDDGYVDCAECGHPIEKHNAVDGCFGITGCPCQTRWTLAEIIEVRVRSGLPRDWGIGL